MTSRRSMKAIRARESRAFQFVPGHVGGRVASAQPVRRLGGISAQVDPEDVVVALAVELTFTELVSGEFANTGYIGAQGDGQLNGSAPVTGGIAALAEETSPGFGDGVVVSSWYTFWTWDGGEVEATWTAEGTPDSIDEPMLYMGAGGGDSDSATLLVAKTDTGEMSLLVGTVWSTSFAEPSSGQHTYRLVFDMSTKTGVLYVDNVQVASATDSGLDSLIDLDYIAITGYGDPTYWDYVSVAGDFTEI